MIDIQPDSPYPAKQHKTGVVPNIQQLNDLTQNQPILGMNKTGHLFFSFEKKNILDRLYENQLFSIVESIVLEFDGMTI
jgi:hypothetical protein